MARRRLRFPAIPGSNPGVFFYAVAYLTAICCQAGRQFTVVCLSVSAGRPNLIMNRSWSRTLIVAKMLQWLDYKTLQLLLLVCSTRELHKHIVSFFALILCNFTFNGAENCLYQLLICLCESCSKLVYFSTCSGSLQKLEPCCFNAHFLGCAK